MNVRAAAELLQAQIGVDPLSLGSNGLSNLIAKRMHGLGLTDPQRYAAYLQDFAEEMTALIEEVVVPETWFFRGGEVFSFLAEKVRNTMESASPAPKVRILSAPCSSGEEPYSMAIALLEAGIPHTQWTIVGIDLSAHSLARARRGVYREASFREMPDSLRRKYFHKRDSGWEIDPALRDRVQFQRGNLLDPELLADAGSFDVIFCRNLLIYLAAEARRLVLANLDRLLAPQGLFCMGHAEPLNLLDPRFQTTGPHAYFLFQRRQAKPPGPIAPNGAAPLAPRKERPSRRPMQRRLRPQPVAAATIAPVDLLLQARQEADAGSLDKARQTCQAHLAAAGPSAPGYSLLGVIHQARREKTEAAECFRRALYLDPHHEEALLHLLLLYQEDGNDAAALRLRRRLERKIAGGAP